MTLTSDQKRAKRTAAQKYRRAQARALAARQREDRDEQIAPAAQRKPVINPAGEVFKTARLARSGAGFAYASPIDQLAASRDWITTGHRRAVKRLEAAWRLVGDGIGTGSSAYATPGGPSGRAPSAPPGHAVLCAQIDAQNELAALQACLGPLWTITRDVCLNGIELAVWGEQRRMSRNAVPGYLRAALDVLLEASIRMDEASDKPRRNRRVRAAQIAA